MSLTRDGGKPNVKQMPYATPQGPRRQMAEGPRSGHVEPGGANGETLSEMPGREFTGSPGIGGKNHGTCGTQGKY